MHFQGKQKILDTKNGSVTMPAKGKNLGVSHLLNLVVNKRDSNSVLKTVLSPKIAEKKDQNAFSGKMKNFGHHFWFNNHACQRKKSGSFSCSQSRCQ